MGRRPQAEAVGRRRGPKGVIRRLWAEGRSPQEGRREKAEGGGLQAEGRRPKAAGRRSKAAAEGVWYPEGTIRSFWGWPKKAITLGK